MEYKIDRKKIQDYTGPITIYNDGLVKINMHVDIRRQPYIRYVAIVHPSVIGKGEDYGWFTFGPGDYSLTEVIREVEWRIAEILHWAENGTLEWELPPQLKE